MAANASWSSSSESKICGNCKATNFEQYKTGWPIKGGGLALLCDPCGSAYEDGRFCETFHSNDSGWRKCVACGERVHCGCVVSLNKIILLETSGVACLSCAIKASVIALHQCDPPAWSFAIAEFVRNLTSPYIVERSNNSDKVNGSKCEQNAIAKSCQSPLYEAQLQMKGHLPNRQPCWVGGQKYLGGKYRPTISDHELQQIFRDLDSVVTPLFEKTLTISDADYQLGRLVIPKKCAQEYFPLISGPEGDTVKILDTRGRVWEFRYRYWTNANSQMYVLDGLKDFMISVQWQAGDIGGPHFYSNILSDGTGGTIGSGVQKGFSGDSTISRGQRKATSEANKDILTVIVRHFHTILQWAEIVAEPSVSLLGDFGHELHSKPKASPKFSFLK